MKVLFTGTRDVGRTDSLKYIDEIVKFLAEREQPITHIIVGGKTSSTSSGTYGIDNVVFEWAERNKIPTTVFYANWDKHGKAAGPIRNKAMCAFARSIHCHRAVAIWDGYSPGTKGTIKLAHEHGMSVLIKKLNKTKYEYLNYSGTKPLLV